MSAEKFRDPEAQELVELAIISMRAAISVFHQTPNVDSLMTTALQVWSDLNSNREIQKRIDEDFRQKRIILNQFATLDISATGDPVRRRYDPYLWAEKIPQEYEYNAAEYILQRSESLLGLLKSFIEPAI